MKNNNKIAIVSASLGVGGAERFASLLSVMLDSLGYEVHNIIILDHVDYDFKGKLVNLGEMFASEKGIFRAIRKGKFIANYLYENEIEIVIDNRTRPAFVRELFTKWIYGKRKAYFVVHSSNFEMYFSKCSNYLYADATKLVCVAKEIENRVTQKFGFNNTTTIYNPIVFHEETIEKPAGIPDKYILFFGRLDEKIKNFTLMLNSFKKSEVYKNGTKLLIVGDGKDKEFIETKIAELGLGDFIHILPFQKEVTPYIQHAHCSILTSRFEGFPMSIVETLAEGIPVICVNCETGPREIIVNKFNGLLVPNHDGKALAKAISSMVNDEDLYESCKNNAKKSVETLSLIKIAQEWKQLLAQK